MRQRVSSGGRLLEWTLRAGKGKVTPDVTGPLVVDEMRSVVGAAVRGVGLGYVFAELVARELELGTLEHVLPT